MKTKTLKLKWIPSEPRTWEKEVFEPGILPPDIEQLQKSIQVRDTRIYCLAGALFILLVSFILVCVMTP